MSYELELSDIVIPITTIEYDDVYVPIQYDLDKNTFFGIFGVNGQIVVVENNSLEKLIKDFEKQVERINEELYEL